MKKAFKTWVAALLCVAATSASAADLPEFSTVDAPHWYQVKFSVGGAILSAFESGNLKTEAARGGASVDWQLIGTRDGFKMKNRAGKYVGFGNSRFTGVTNESDAVTLHLNANNNEWEIGRVDQSNYMNQWEGTGVGRELGEWEAGNANNRLTFASVMEGEDPTPFPTVTEMPVSSALTAEGFPQLSSENSDNWYYIQFSSGNLISCPDLSGVVRTTGVDQNPNLLWKFVGDSYDNVQIVSIRGAYLTTANRYVRAGETASTNGFKIVAGSNGTFQIMANGIEGNNKFFNQDGGTGAGVSVGLWVDGDPNNPLNFVTIEDVRSQFADMNLGDVTHSHPALAEYGYTGSTTYKPEQPLTLWYKRPGTVATDVQRWMHMGLPIGNGQFGATVLGGIHADELSYNEKTLWTGKPGANGNYGCYQSFGTVYVQSLDEEGLADGVTDYWRNLDLNEAVANVHFTNNKGVTFERHYLASNPDNVIAMRLTASQPGAINTKFFIVPGTNTKLNVNYSDNTCSFFGKLETIRFASEMRVIPDNADATVIATADGIEVKGADAVTVILAGGTDYDPVTPSFTNGQTREELQGTIHDRVMAAAQKGWDAILAAHVADHQSLFNRVNLTFDGAVNELPTDEMIQRYQSTKNSSLAKNKAVSLMLESLYFAYGRYLLIGSSRGVDSPANLQGIWSGYDVQRPYGGQIAPWNADIHNNINLQMCYWPAEPTNLSELHLPLLNYLINNATIQPQWHANAVKSGQTKGWTFFTESSIFNGSGVFMQNYTIANAWCATHLWQHYLYTLDVDFLERAFPTMWSAAEFWVERLVKADDGTWECPNEYSPEHGPGSQNATAHSQQLVWELFSNCLDALDVLGDRANVDAQTLADLKERFEHLDRGLAIETYTGAWGNEKNGIMKGDPIMREWKYSDYSAGQNGHRHNSHMMCLYPYAQVKAGTPEFDAVVNSLKLRGDGATGWSMGWKVNLWARALQGAHARTIIKNALSPASTDMANKGGSGVYNNLFDSHSPFQIDGNFGVTSAVAEMLVQSHAGYIHLLPACPAYWAGGKVTGLKAQGNFTVDVTWADKTIKSAVITSNAGADLKVFYKADGNQHLRFTVDGQTVEPKADENGMLVIPTVKGSQVDVVYDADYTNPNLAESSITDVVADGNMEVNVSNGTIYVNGDVAAVSVYDLAGRQLASVAGSAVKVANRGVVVVRATAANGEVRSAKVAL